MGMGCPFGVMMETVWTWVEVMVAYNVAYVLCATELYMLKGFILCYVNLTSMSKFRKTEKAVPDLPGQALVRAQLSPPEPQVSSPFQRVFTLSLPLMGGSLPLYLGSWAFSLRPHFTLQWGQVVLCGCGRRIVLAWDSEYILHSHVQTRVLPVDAKPLHCARVLVGLTV